MFKLRLIFIGLLFGVLSSSSLALGSTAKEKYCKTLAFHAKSLKNAVETVQERAEDSFENLRQKLDTLLDKADENGCRPDQDEDQVTTKSNFLACLIISWEIKKTHIQVETVAEATKDQIESIVSRLKRITRRARSLNCSEFSQE